MPKKTKNEVWKSVEALLFASGKGMSPQDISALLKLPLLKIKGALSKIKRIYDERDSALKITDNAGYWKMTVKDDYVSIVKSIVADADLSTAVMETLALIAYRYPVALQSEVVHARGDTAYEHIKELLDLGFITREKKGNSYAIRLTKRFFEYFDLEGSKDLKNVLEERALKKRKEIKEQMNLDDITVYEAKGGNKNKVGNLDVVDIPEEKDLSKRDDAFVKPDIQKIERNPKEEAANADFLKEIDEKINEIVEKRKERDTEEPMKRLTIEKKESAEDDTPNNTDVEEKSE